MYLHLVDEPGLEEPPDDARAAREPDVLAARGPRCSLQGALDPFVAEGEGRAAPPYPRFPRAACQDEARRPEGRGVRLARPPSSNVLRPTT